MQLVVLGPPGAGKGTQARMVADRYRIPAISTGALFRAAVSDDSAFGRSVREHLTEGGLVPDPLTISAVARRLAQPDTARGFLLDGFPRTADQALSLGGLLSARGATLDAALALRVGADEVARRLSGRRTCSSCGAIWHVVFRPTRDPDRCDGCDGVLYRRDDDCETAVRARLIAYEAHTAPVLDFYARSGRLIEIAAGGAVADVAGAVSAALRDLDPTRRGGLRRLERTVHSSVRHAPRRSATGRVTRAGRGSAGA